MPIARETKTTAAGSVRAGGAAPGAQPSERGAAAACGETSFRPGGREKGAGLRLPGPRASGHPVLRPVPDPGSLCDLGLHGQPGLHFPPAHGACGPGPCQGPSHCGRCLSAGAGGEAGHSLPGSQVGANGSCGFLTSHPQVNCREMAGQCRNLRPRGML